MPDEANDRIRWSTSLEEWLTSSFSEELISVATSLDLTAVGSPSVKPLRTQQFESTLSGFGWRDDCANAKPLDVVQSLPSSLHFVWVELDDGLRTEDVLLVLYRDKDWLQLTGFSRGSAEIPKLWLTNRQQTGNGALSFVLTPCMGSVTAELLLVSSMALISSWRTNGAGLPASMGTPRTARTLLAPTPNQLTVHLITLCPPLGSLLGNHELCSRVKQEPVPLLCRLPDAHFWKLHVCLIVPD